MDDKEIEKLAKALFEKENTDPTTAWDAVAVAHVAGADTVAGVGEEVRDNYRARIRAGESP